MKRFLIEVAVASAFACAMLWIQHRYAMPNLPSVAIYALGGFLQIALRGVEHV